MNRRCPRTKLVLLSQFIAVSLAMSAAPLLGGPLFPPAGVVQGTMKPISDVEPRTAMNAANTPGDADSMFRITAAGSYYLAANLDVLPNKRGIEIAADNVTVDLSGFRVGGYPGSLQGIKVAGTNRVNIAVKNGSVWNLGGSGVDFQGDQLSATTTGCRARELSIRGCGGNGIVGVENTLIDSVVAIENTLAGIVGDHTIVVRDCIAADNGGAGIDASEGGLVVHCQVTGNDGGGIKIRHGSVLDCTVLFNSGNGVEASYATVSGCTLSQNRMIGIAVTGTSVIKANTLNGVNFPGTVGISCTGPDGVARIEDNACSYYATGIKVTTSGHFIVRNTCLNNSTNWDISAGNLYGPIVDRSTLNSAPVNGDSAAGVLGTSDPNANFSH